MSAKFGSSSLAALAAAASNSAYGRLLVEGIRVGICYETYTPMSGRLLN